MCRAISGGGSRDTRGAVLTARAPNQHEDEPRTITTRSVVIGLTVGLPLSVLFLWLAVRGVNFGDVWRALADANLALVIVAMPLVLMLFPMQGLRWRHLVIAPCVPERRVFIVLMFIGTAITNVVPGRPGDIVRGVWLSRLVPIPVARSLTSVGVDRAVDVATVFAILLVCLPFVDRPDWLITLVILGATLCALAVTILVVAWWYAHRKNPEDPAAAIDRGDKSWFRHQVSGVIRGLAVLSRPREVLAALGLSLAGWAFTIAGAWLVAASLGLSIGLAGSAFTMAVLALGSAIPSSPGMIGTYQWLAVASLGVVGVAKPEALAFSILFQATWYIPVTLSGAPGAWWLTKRGRSNAGAAAKTVTDSAGPRPL